MVETRRRSARGQSPGSARSKSPAPKAPSRKPKADTEAASPGLVSALPLLALVVAYATMVFLANSTSNGAGTTVDWMGFSGKDVDAFASSLMMILVSELGDKTFFIAAVLAMKHSRAVVLVGSLGALALMTALSAIMGKILTDLLPHEYTHYLAVLLFVVFGVKLLKDAQGMSAEGPSEELEEVEAELNKNDKKKDPDVETGKRQPKNSSLSLVDGVLWQAFTLTFVAEWGDRSQVSTIAMAATKNMWLVTAGGVVGHAVCTSMAVIGGRILASRISERTVALGGGICFIIFAVHGMLQDPSTPHND